MKKWLIFILPTLAFADDASRIAANKTAVDTVVTNRSYLSATLGITTMNSIVHPDWVQVDFPLTSSSGASKRRIEAAIRDLIAKGGEPAYRDSTAGLPRGQYVRTWIPGRVYVHRDVAVTILKRISGGVDTSGTGIGAAVRDTCADGGWRNFLHDRIPERF